MKRFLVILILACSVWSFAQEQSGQDVSKTSPAQPAQQPSSDSPAAAPNKPAADIAGENLRKAKDLIAQAITALGGKAYLNIRDRELQGRTFGFHHGRSSGNGVLFWGFSQFPDKERDELTPQRDVSELYVGNKAWEITYKGAHPLEEKDVADYLRRRRFSLDTLLRTWVNDPNVVLIYDGNATAAQHPALQVTLINAQNESVTIDFDADTYLPVKKSFEWRDPVDRQKNLEEEVYENYRFVAGTMAPYNITRFFNGDMASERFLFNVTINQGLDQAMFDPNSGYNPIKAQGKH
jgi:hypothetical protein